MTLGRVVTQDNTGSQATDKAVAVSPYARAAREYWRKGWTNPLPISGKNLPPKGYTGFNGMDVSFPDLMEWESSGYKRNIALRSQGSWVGVDVDAYDEKVGAATLAEYEARLGKLPPTISSTSRGQGQASRIYFFSIPPGTKVSAEGAMRDIEIVRREHRYAMVWPSVHPKTGETYQWYGADFELLAEVPSISDMAPWPTAWLDEFTAKPSTYQGNFYTDGAKPAKALGFAEPARTFTRQQADAERERKLEALRSASRGQVNASLGGAARWLYRFVPEFWERQDVDRALALALADADRRLGTTDPSTWGPDPWSPQQQVDTAWARSLGDWHAVLRPEMPTLEIPASAQLSVPTATYLDTSAPAPIVAELRPVETAPERSLALASTGFGAPLGADQGVEPEAPAAPPVADQVPAGDAPDIATEYGLLLWDPFFSTDLTNVEWLAGSLLQRGRQAALVGEAKSGKSLLSLEWACAIASGKPFLGDAAREPLVVAYIDQENGRADIQGRLRGLGYGAGDLRNLRYLSFPPIGPLDTPTGAASLIAAVKAMGAQVVFLDTISRMIEGKENDSDPWLAMYRNAMMPLKKEGVSVIRLDHLGKNTGGGARGSSAKTGDVDEVWELRLGAGGDLLLEKTHTRTGIGTDKFRLKRTGRAGEVGTTSHLASVILDDEAADAPGPASITGDTGVIDGEVFTEAMARVVGVITATFGYNAGATKQEIKSIVTSKGKDGAGLSVTAFYRTWAKLESLRWVYMTGGKYYLRNSEDRALLRKEDIERGAIKPGGIVK